MGRSSGAGGGTNLALRAVTPVLVLVVCIAAAVSLIVARGADVATYVTHPVSIVALGGAAVSIAAIASGRKLLTTGSTSWLLALSASVTVYLALGAIATATHDPSGPSSVWVGLWGAWWIVPLVIVQLTALRIELITPRWAAVLVVVTAIAVAVATMLAAPSAPFMGVAPAAPAGWNSSLILSLLTLLICTALVVAPLALALRARRTPAQHRAAALLVAVASSVPPLLIVVCVGLAVLTSGGDVAPTLGSVAYYVAYSIGLLVAAVALTAADRLMTLRPRSPADRLVRTMVLGVSASYGVVAIVIAGTWISATLSDVGTTATVVAITTLVLGVALLWWRASTALLRHDRPAVDEPLTARLVLLSPRENEVLALVADGCRDADIAARLHLSQRTVEAHLRRVFQKLQLDADDGRNRRLVAARVWLESSTLRSG
ncbi:MAG: helix-turn-helix transcriptional regulator [Microcella sp.]|uniref:helix-turn-helix transcriptional regulator n=1 Tax=Microcella sp. TaxID=1913979 RepID=UPI0024C5D2C7|nr:helix-turn-helix transcriptional regulator [Microcella sp.]UYN84420.1 MAG: helix-turn-helix transcriptional regulator [Microcella sp.]